MNHERGAINYVERGGGPPTWLWVMVTIGALGYCLYSMMVHAEGPRLSRCTWEMCKLKYTGATVEIIDCEPAQEGTHLDLALAFEHINEPNRAIKYACEPKEEGKRK